MQPQHKKLAGFILFLAIISVVIYAVLKLKKPKYNPTTNLNFDATGGNTNSNTGSSTGGSSASTNTVSFPLKKGARNKYVKALQIGLNRRYAAKLSEDGIFGAKTHTAVEKYLDYLAVKQGQSKPSQIGVWWSLFTSLGFEKYV